MGRSRALAQATIALPRGCSERNSAAAAVEMMESGYSGLPVCGLIRFSAPRLIGATVTPLNARLADFPIHFAAQIGGNAAQLHVQPVAGAAAGQAEDKFNPRLFQRMMLSDDAAAMPL